MYVWVCLLRNGLIWLFVLYYFVGV